MSGGTVALMSGGTYDSGTKVAASTIRFLIFGGTNVMLCYWWHKCHILTIGGTNVAVGKMSWWDKCQVGQMSVGQTSVGQKLRHCSYHCFCLTIKSGDLFVILLLKI